jgi:hypothetical protein
MRIVKLGSNNISRLRSGLASALMLWCAGAGCMMVSYARGAAMTAAGANIKSRSGWGQASGSVGAHDCCKARHASERRVVSSPKEPANSSANLEELSEGSNSSDAMSCCPLTSGTFVVSGRQNLSNENVSASPGAAAQPIVISVTVAFVATPLRLPDQTQTYLRDCVFLI